MWIVCGILGIPVAGGRPGIGVGGSGSKKTKIKSTRSATGPFWALFKTEFYIDDRARSEIFGPDSSSSTRSYLFPPTTQGIRRRNGTANSTIQ